MIVRSEFCFLLFEIYLLSLCEFDVTFSPPSQFANIPVFHLSNFPIIYPARKLAAGAASSLTPLFPFSISPSSLFFNLLPYYPATFPPFHLSTFNNKLLLHFCIHRRVVIYFWFFLIFHIMVCHIIKLSPGNRNRGTIGFRNKVDGFFAEIPGQRNT